MAEEENVLFLLMLVGWGRGVGVAKGVWLGWLHGVLAGPLPRQLVILVAVCFIDSGDFRD